MVVHQYVNSLIELEQAVREFERMKYTVHTEKSSSQAPEESPKKPIYIIVSGEKDANGKSWCPDCVKGKTLSGDNNGRRYIM